MGIVGNVSSGFIRGSAFVARLRRKGARRRRWWNPKLLHGRLYKGHGSGTMMQRSADGVYSLNPEKVRTYEMPENFNESLRPYVAPDVIIPDTPKPTQWDYFNLMEKTWGPESEKMFQSFSKMWWLGQRSGGKGKWGA